MRDMKGWRDGARKVCEGEGKGGEGRREGRGRAEAHLPSTASEETAPNR